jgi:type I restriction enzyme M protein
VLFVDYIAEHLTQDGRAAVIVPEGIIFQSGNAYKQLRKMLVEKYLVGVISLPAGVFNPYSGVKTSILWLDKSLAKKTDKIFFVKIENDGFDLGAQRRAVKGNDLPTALQKTLDYRNHINVGKIYDLELQDGFSLVKKTDVGCTGDYNLSGDRYITTIKYNGKWEVKKLENLCYKITDGSHNPPPSTDGGKLILSSQNIFNHRLVLDNVRYLSDSSFLVENKRTDVSVGDVLLTIVGTIGRCLVVDESMPKFALQRSVAVFKPTKEVNSYFLSYMLLSDKIQKKLISESKGVAQKGIYLKELKSIEIPIPPLSIQEKIAAEIESYQKIIDGARQVVENYKPRIDIDPEWEIVELSEVCYVKGGKRVPKGESFSENKTPFPYIRVTDLREMSVDLSGLKYIPKSIQSLISRYIISKEDVYISIAGTIGLFGTIPDQLDGANLTENAAKLVIIDNKLDRFYLTFIGNSQVVQAQIKKLTHAVGVPKLALERIKSIEIPIPPIDVQRKISEQIIQELAIVDANKQMIQIFEQKIKDRIAKVWGE